MAVAEGGAMPLPFTMASKAYKTARVYRPQRSSGRAHPDSRSGSARQPIDSAPTADLVNAFPAIVPVHGIVATRHRTYDAMIKTADIQVCVIFPQMLLNSDREED